MNGSIWTTQSTTFQLQMESDKSIHAQLKYGHALVWVNTSLKSINYVTEQQNMVIINKCISISDVLRDRDKQL